MKPETSLVVLFALVSSGGCHHEPASAPDHGGSPHASARAAPSVEAKPVAPRTPGAHLAHADSHTCAIVDGALYCWGANGAGQLGIVPPDVATSAIRVPGLPQVVHVAVDELSTCAVGVDGGLYCFGFTYELRGRAAALRAATRVPGFEGVVSVALGNSHRCALFASGKVACFGDDVALLGGRTDEEPQRAAIVEGLPPMRSLVASSHVTCGLDRDGAAWCFGESTCGEIKEKPRSPRRVPGLDALAELSLQDEGLCGVDAKGQGKCVRCPRDTPRLGEEGVPTPELRDVRQVSADRARGCVVTATRGVACWGDLRKRPGPDVLVVRPGGLQLAPVGGLSNVAEIALTASSACAITRGGEVRCWGQNRRGELGAGSVPWAPVVATTDPGIGAGGYSDIAAAGSLTCAITSAGGADCFGDVSQADRGAGGRMLAGSTMLWSTGTDVCGNGDDAEPACVGADRGSSGPDVRDASPLRTRRYASGPEGKCIVTEAGRVRCAPREDKSKLLEGLERLTGVQTLVFGAKHACVATERGSVLCAGENEHAQLGRAGAATTQPLKVAGLADINHLAATETQTCALSVSGQLFCWGIDERMGEMSNRDGRRPRLVLSDVRQIVAGQRHFCALTTTWQVRCWGSDERGQLGDSTELKYQVDPVQVAFPAGASPVSLAAGATHSCALFHDGTIRCWGSNDRGEIGERIARRSYDRPFSVAGLPRPVGMGSNPEN